MTNDFPFLDFLQRIYFQAVAICRHQLLPGQPKPSLLHSIHNIYARKVAQASDPRDRIFSILGLTNASELGIKADYTKSCATVYKEVAETLIRNHELFILSYCVGVEATPEIPVPSWAPDLTQQLIYPLGIDRRFQCLYSASGTKKQRVREASNWGSNRLELSGIQIGKIMAVGRAAPESTQWNANDMRGWIGNLQLLASEVLENASEEEINEIAWRTAIADNLDTSNGTRRRCQTSDLDEFSNVVLQLRNSRHGNINSMQISFEIASRAFRRRAFRTDNGYLGLGRDTCTPDDEIWILLRHPTPFILRPGLDSGYILVGEAYIHGVMDGEFVQDNVQVENIVLY